MITEKEKIVLMALSAYTYNGICDINIDNIKSTGLGKDSIKKATELLELEGYVEDITLNGFYPRFKIQNPIECPSFIFAEDLTLGNKVVLVRALDRLESFHKIPIRTLSKQLYGDDAHCSTIYKVKDKSGKTVFEHLEELQYVKLLPTHDKYKLIPTDFGLQIDNSDFTIKDTCKCLICGEENPVLMLNKSRCRKCASRINSENLLSNPAKFLYSKSRNSKNQKSRYIPHTITVEDVEDQLQEQYYSDYYTGLKFTNVKQMSLDRIDSSKGYEVGNIVVTDVVINTMKNNLSINEFKEYIRNIYNNIDNF